MGVPVRFDYVEVVLKLHKAGGGVGWNPTDLETVYFGAQTTRRNPLKEEGRGQWRKRKDEKGSGGKEKGWERVKVEKAEKGKWCVCCV